MEGHGEIWLAGCRADRDDPRAGLGAAAGRCVQPRASFERAIGTPGAVVALRRIEADAKKWAILPPAMAFGRYPSAISHMSDSTLQLAASIANDAGMTYGVVRAGFLGGEDVFLLSSEAPEKVSSWSRPRLIPNALVAGQITDVSLTWQQPGVLLFRFTPTKSGGPQSVRIAIADVLRDSDGDGWTDVEEERLSRGPVLFEIDRDKWIAGHGSAPPLLSWGLVSKSATDALVGVSDCEGSLAAASYEVRLRKIEGEWFVVAFTMRSIS